MHASDTKWLSLQTLAEALVVPVLLSLEVGSEAFWKASGMLCVRRLREVIICDHAVFGLSGVAA